MAGQQRSSIDQFSGSSSRRISSEKLFSASQLMQ
jgi:hypothetical protein